MTAFEEIIVVGTATNAGKPIRVYYHDGTFKDFTAEEAANEDTGGIGMAHTIARVTLSTVEYGPMVDLGVVSECQMTNEL